MNAVILTLFLVKYAREPGGVVLRESREQPGGIRPLHNQQPETTPSSAHSKLSGSPRRACTIAIPRQACAGITVIHLSVVPRVNHVQVCDALVSANKSPFA